MSRSKNRKIADLISGGTFDDGVVAASEVTGLHSVASTGNFNELSNKPAPFDPATLAGVAVSGSFNDLSDQPAPFDPSTLATVATTGAYSSLSGTPALITNNNQLTNGAGYTTTAGASSINELSDGYVSASNPTVTTNAALGSLWLNSTSGKVYVCVDATTNANIWALANSPTTEWIPVQYPVATGGTITTHGNFKRHTFTSSGNFVVTRGGAFNFLIVSGGGAGGNFGGVKVGGGGGAGGRKLLEAVTLTAGTHVVTVGAGMAISLIGRQSAPSSSIGSSYSSTGGGMGGDASRGGYASSAGSDGGSGGGGSYNINVGGTGIIGEGNDGGDSVDDVGAGGGGAGGVGANGGQGSTSSGANGGNGLATSGSNGFPTTTYAGGGGGGVRSSSVLYGFGGTGGGGFGGQPGQPTGPQAGTANTGGGGGGAGYNTIAGAGGSGIVIVTYQFQ